MSRIKENWISFITLLFREITRIIRIWPQSLMPSATTITLYFVIFGNIIGTRIGNINGIPYIHYMAPGLIMLSIINNSYVNVSSSLFSNKFQHNIEEMIIAPMSNHIIILGFVGGSMVRGILVGTIVTTISLIFCKFSIYSWSVVLIIALLTSILFALAGYINGMLANKFDDIFIVPTFILTPLIYLGGVFYSIDFLPKFWQTIIRFNPIMYMVNGFRWGFLGQSDISINVSLAILFITAFLFYCICWWMMEHGIGIKS